MCELEVSGGSWMRVHEPGSAAATQGPQRGRLEPFRVKGLTPRRRRAVDRSFGRSGSRREVTSQEIPTTNLYHNHHPYHTTTTTT